MRKFPLIGALALFPALALVLVVGCTNTPKNDPPKPSDDKKTAPATKGKEKGEPIKTATEGTIKGVVKIKGEIPKMPRETAMEAHKDAKICLQGNEHEKVKQEWIVDEKGNVANVVISLAPPTGKAFNVTAELKKLPPAVMDQPHCQYVPHMLAVLADSQDVVFKNSAPTGHNVKIEQVGDNSSFDQLMEPNATPIKRQFSKADRPIGVQCSIHPWMNAKIHVFNHPYFAVSGLDGSFEIKNVPVDTELTVYVWHEAKGERVEARKATFKKGDNTLELEIAR